MTLRSSFWNEETEVDVTVAVDINGPLWQFVQFVLPDENLC